MIAGYTSEPLKEVITFVCAFLCAPLLRIFHKGSLRIAIYYHGVNDSSVANFGKQMAYLATNCTVVKPSRIKEAPANGADHIVAITFDDAFQSVMKNAVPILKKYALPAGIFVPAGNLGQAPSWEIPENCPDKNETVMGQRQIVELDSDGFEIFSHTVSHRMLVGLYDSRLEDELVNSKQVLEKLVGHPILGISYPSGTFDARVCEATQKAGYKFAFTIEPTTVDGATDCFRIGRVRVSPKDSLLKFKLKVTGAYRVTGYLRRLKTWLSVE